MIGLMFLAGIAVWLVVVSYLSKWILDLLDPKWRKAPVRALFFVVLLILPMADEIIGRWQFNRLCERESVIYLSDDWQKVKRAKNVSLDQSLELAGYATRIQESELRYQDADTGKIFLRYKSFRNYGGLLMDKIGLRLSGEPTSCWPINDSQVRKEINLQKLLDQGGVK